jgi:hypothetical protein
MMKRLLMMVALLAGVNAGHAVERHSNGLGGGRWTDPGSWHDKSVPASTDVVVIASGDTLQLDAEVAVCAGLLIDPDGVLTVRPGEQSRMLRLTGPVESYGLIRVDATRARGGTITIRVESDEAERRAIRLNKNAGLLLYGPVNTEDGRPGISLETVRADGTNAPGVITAGSDVLLDLSNVRLLNFALQASGLDNTGFKQSERLNLTGCRFEGYGRVELRNCDSAVVAGNRFLWEEAGDAPAPAVSTASCKLSDLRQNTVSGRFADAFDLGAETDGSVTSNTVEGAVTGFSLRSCANAMFRANAALGCSDGFRATASSGAVEGMRVKGTKRAVVLVGSQMQLADVRIDETPVGGIPFFLEGSSAVLLNVNVATNQVQRNGPPPAGKEPWLTLMHYLVVKAAGAAAPGSEVSVATAAASGGAPGGLSDLNVRSSPARILANGLTPLPRSLRCLVVRGWRLENDGTVREAPFYELKVMGPPDPKTGQRPVLKTQVVEPRESWYRAEPDAPTPTLEVKW